MSVCSSPSTTLIRSSASSSAVWFCFPISFVVVKATDLFLLFAQTINILLLPTLEATSHVKDILSLERRCQTKEGH